MPVIKVNEKLSERGKVLYAVGGFKFRFHKKLAKNIGRYCCTTNECSSLIKFIFKL